MRSVIPSSGFVSSVLSGVNTRALAFPLLRHGLAAVSTGIV